MPTSTIGSGSTISSRSTISGGSENAQNRPEGISPTGSEKIAFFLPPVGVGLYIACGIGKVDLNRTIPVYVPYLAALLVGLIFVTYVPWFTLVLPRLVLGYGVK